MALPRDAMGLSCGCLRFVIVVFPDHAHLLFLVALLLLSIDQGVLWHFLAVSWVGLHYVIVVYPDHTHLFFY